MTNVVYRSIGDIGGDLAVLDAERRLYVGLSRDGSYYHVVEPLQADIVEGIDNDVIRPAGALACRCKGGTFRGVCYRVTEAEALEAGDVKPFASPDWLEPRVIADEGTATFDAPAGAGDLVEAFRG
jgi:hypothetical protein